MNQTTELNKEKKKNEMMVSYYVVQANLQHRNSLAKSLEC